jgi:hypothetical protein
MPEYQTILGGGPYIVRRNEYGGVEREIGWATIKIKDGSIIQVVCDDNIIGNANISVFRHQMRNKIPDDYKYYENIQIMFQRGYNANFAYNFSDVEIFKRVCKNYFDQLDERIDREKESKTESKLNNKK